MSLARLLAGLLLVLPIVGHRAAAAGAEIYEVNGSATAPGLVFADDAIAWTITPSQNMLLDGPSTTFGRVAGTTSLGTVLQRSVRISLHEGSTHGALKARIDVFVDAQGGEHCSVLARGRLAASPLERETSQRRYDRHLGVGIVAARAVQEQVEPR